MEKAFAWTLPCQDASKSPGPRARNEPMVMHMSWQHSHTGLDPNEVGSEIHFFGLTEGPIFPTCNNLCETCAFTASTDGSDWSARARIDGSLWSTLAPSDWIDCKEGHGRGHVWHMGNIFVWFLSTICVASKLFSFYGWSTYPPEIMVNKALLRETKG